MSDQSEAPEPLGPDNDEAQKTSGAAFLPIGIAFLGVGVAFLANDDMRATAWAFLPLGVTFLILGVSANARQRRPEAGDTEPGDGNADGSERP